MFHMEMIPIGSPIITSGRTIFIRTYQDELPNITVGIGRDLPSAGRHAALFLRSEAQRSVTRGVM